MYIMCVSRLHSQCGGQQRAWTHDPEIKNWILNLLWHLRTPEIEFYIKGLHIPLAAMGCSLPSLCYQMKN